MNLLPCPRELDLAPGQVEIPLNGVLLLPEALARSPVVRCYAEWVQREFSERGVELELAVGNEHPRAIVRCFHDSVGGRPESYSLQVQISGVHLNSGDAAGMRAGLATLIQLVREHGRRLPLVRIADYPDFSRRGVMLDVSRGRVPNLQALLRLVENLALFKINEFQLYVEHTFAYRDFEPVWRGWGPLTGDDILKLDARCRELGIDLVPNQNSFGHLRYWLEYPPLRPLAEVTEPYPSADGTYVRYPSTLAPLHPGTIPFLRGLYRELLPHFSSEFLNVGCDETWDLGLGQSRESCARLGEGRVYLEFLKKIHKEVRRHGRRVMFWGDIILHYPELIKELPKDVIALNWGYEADHPFEKETEIFAESGIPFYVCPGTSTWMSLIGRNDNGLMNLRRSAEAGTKQGALGYLNTDWGDGGHPQPLAVGYPLYAAGAALSWCGAAFQESTLEAVLSRDVYDDPSQRIARAALAMGVAHREFRYTALNVTPFGAVIAAPRPETRELCCRDGLKYYARIAPENIRRAREAVEEQRKVLYQSTPATFEGELLACELDMAARMAIESCHIMEWQQRLADGRKAAAAKVARRGIAALRQLEKDYAAYWPLRNKGSIATSAPFLRWRIADYQEAKLHFPPEVARLEKPKTRAAE